MKNQPPRPHVQTLYRCPDGCVRVIRKSRGLRRYPNHSYACVMFLLRPEDGTRVQTKADGSIEFMASLDELKAMLIGIEPKLASVLPTNMRNKPRETQLRWRIRNEFRKGKRGTK